MIDDTLLLYPLAWQCNIRIAHFFLSLSMKYVLFFPLALFSSCFINFLSMTQLLQKQKGKMRFESFVYESCCCCFRCFSIRRPTKAMYNFASNQLQMFYPRAHKAEKRFKSHIILPKRLAKHCTKHRAAQTKGLYYHYSWYYLLFNVSWYAFIRYKATQSASCTWDFCLFPESDFCLSFTVLISCCIGRDVIPFIFVLSLFYFLWIHSISVILMPLNWHIKRWKPWKCRAKERNRWNKNKKKTNQQPKQIEWIFLKFSGSQIIFNMK